MGENHLTYFKIENFKRFDSFEMENLGQYNLLVGDNNVGKTSVLEALLFEDNDPKFTFDRYFVTLKEGGRKIITQKRFDELSKKTPVLLWKLITNKDFLKISYIKKGEFSKNEMEFIERNDTNLEDGEVALINKSYKNSFMTYKNFWLVAKYNEKPIWNSNTFFEENNTNEDYKNCNSLVYSFDKLRGFSISGTYQIFVDSDKNNRIEFNESFKTILPNLEEIRPYFSEIIEEPSIGIVLKNNPITMPIEQFGDGVLKVFRILVSIFIARKKRLLIDEIETGIHFSRLKDFWKTVITLCKKYDVQLFATTHSLECQKYFVFALEELEEEDRKNARNITLVENAKGEVKSVTFDYEQFEFALEIGANTRGGER